MSCLPFAAWAAKKAAEIVGASGGSSGGGLPVVEIAELPTPGGEEIMITGVEAEALNECAATGIPIIISIPFGGGTQMKTVFNAFTENGIAYGYAALLPFEGIAVFVNKVDETTWSIYSDIATAADA